MEKNILKVWIDRAGRITESINLSLNQCSDNNEFRVYYTDEVFTNLEISFRKPDGWVSDKFSMSHTLEVDEIGLPTGHKYGYINIPEEITSFILSGRNGIITGNLYIHTKNADGNTKINTVGNIRINVNYVDDAKVHTGFSQMYIDSINANITNLHNKIIDVQEGNILVSRAISDRFGNTIDTTYETKLDAETKFDILDDRKLDRVELQDQTQRISALETNSSLTANRIIEAESDIEDNEANISKNSEDIKNLSNSTVKYDEYNKHLLTQQKKDEDLQKQIDDIASSSNIADMVDTYASLQTYDTSKLDDGDRIQVLMDAGHENASTIWRYNSDKDALGQFPFDYIGKYATVAYTRSEIDSQHNEIKSSIPNKIVSANDSISLFRDTVQIPGQTPIKFKTVNGQSIFGSGNIPAAVVDSKFDPNSANPVENRLITAALANKANKSDVDAELSKKADKTAVENKQDKLIAGPNIKIIDNEISADIGITIKKVDALPQIGFTNVIYLVPNIDGSFNEYIWISEENKFEILGDTRINLNDYYLKTEVNELLANKADNSALNTLNDKVSANIIAISAKADRTVVNDISDNVDLINKNLDNKVNSSDFKTYQDTVQNTFNTKNEKLVSGENIKRVEDGETPYEQGQDENGNPIKVFGEKKSIDILGNGSINIKTINGKSLIGEGEILLADTNVIDLSNYITESRLEDRLSTKVDKEDLKNIEIDYNNLKNKPDLDGLQTQIKADIRNDISSVSDVLTEEILELSENVYTKEETYDRETIESKINEVDISGKLGDYYTKEEVDSAIQEHNPDLTGYATETWVEGKNYLTKTEAASKYVLYDSIPADVPSREYVDQKVASVDVSSQLTDYAKTEYVDKKISDLIDSAPETLDTLSEIADALNNNSGTINILNQAIGNKQDKLIAGANIDITGNTISAVIDIDSDIVPALNLNEYAKKVYVDNIVAAEVAKVVGAAPEELNTLYELSEAISDNKDTISELENIATGKQDKLISGSNIKTINGQSLLGDGNIKVAGSFNDLTNKDNVLISATVSGDILTIRNVANETVTFKGTTDYTKLINTPTKLSQFTNDAKYATTDDVSAEIAKVIAGADSKYDTLKEIADYIASDTTNAAAMSATIEANKTNITMAREDITALTNRVSKNENDILILKNKDISLDADINLINQTLKAHNLSILNNDERIKELEKIDHNALANDISNLKTTTSVHTGNISDINSKITKINNKDSEQDTALSEIKETLGNFDGTLEDFYTKEQSDEKFLEYNEIISKSEGIVDYNNRDKIIKFTTDVANSEFTITKADFSDISRLLTMMVPNEY